MKKFVDLKDVAAVSAFPGHFRRTVAANDDMMMCVFEMKAGTQVELHSHPAAQVGIILEGEIAFFSADGSGFTGGPGASYIFDSNELHGCAARTDCKFVECFAPARAEYDN